MTGQIYHVDSKAASGGTGTAIAPFTTISAAAAVAQAGDTVIVDAGTYSELVKVQNSGTPANPITFVANGAVTITGADGGFEPAQWAGDNDVANLSGNNWVTLKGFTFSGISDIAVRASTGWTLNDITVQNSAFGVNIRGNNVTVENSTFRNINGPSAHAMVAVGGANVRILNNLIDGVNTTNQTYIDNSAVTKFVYTTGLVIDGNTSENNHGPGLWLDTGNTDFTISNNIIQNNNGVQQSYQGGGLWIEANAGANGKIFGNKISDNQGSGISVMESNGLNIYDNTLTNNGANLEFRNLPRSGTDLTVHDINVHNNLFDGAVMADIGTWTGDFTGFNNPSALNISINNDTYQGPVSVLWDGTTYNSLAALRAGTGFETNSPPPIEDTLVLNLSADLWKGAPQFLVTVDGKQQGAAQSVTAVHSQGQSQTFTFSGLFGPGTHKIGVSFINDAYGGTPTTDRNLYVGSISYDGVTYPGTSATLLGNGTHYFTVGHE